MKIQEPDIGKKRKKHRQKKQAKLEAHFLLIRFMVEDAHSHA